MRRTIIYFHTGHPNDAESLAYQRHAFRDFGYTIEDFSVSSPTIAQDLGNVLVKSGSEIAFFLSSNYYGTRIANARGELLHTMTGIPLVIMHHDHPRHFISQQSSRLNGTVTFVIGDEAVDFVESYYPIETTVVTRSGARPQRAERAPVYEDFLAKDNSILCPMNLAVNGAGLDANWQLIKQLPPARRTFAVCLAEIAITDCSTPLHQLARALPPLEGPEFQATIADQLLVHNFIKAWRRNAMVRALIDLPIIISSEYVPADLEFKYPKKFTLFSRDQTMPLYAQFRFVLNCGPVMTDVLHERVLEALFANGVAISDPNRAIARFLRDESEYLLFDYADANIASKIGAFLDDPQRAYTLTEHAYAKRRASRDFGLVDSYARLIDVIEARWANRAVPESVGA